MGTVVSLERAAARRGLSLNYFSNLMVTIPQELFLVDLPLQPGEPTVPTLVTVLDKNASGCRVLLSDVGGSVVSDFTFLGAGGAIPGTFNPRSLGELAKYLTRAQEHTNQVVMAGGIQHGNLTIARAVHLMAAPGGLDAAQALQEALEQGAACEQWARGVQQTARQVLAA